MDPLWLISNSLWLGLVLLLASAFARSSALAGLGWIFFGIFWLGQPAHYLSTADYFNIALTLLAGLLCFYLAGIILSKRCKTIACEWATYAAAICGIVYYPFAEFDILNSWLIGETALVTVQFLRSFSLPASLASWNVIALNGQTVEIILACTAIESIALFIGIILSVKASPKRKYAALVASIFIIYFLNIVRNAFVIIAYSQEWFGANSFYVAHNVIAKVGSTVALLAVAYLVLSILPELLESIDSLGRELSHSRRR